jgi:HTH-type transcriptional regulator/antitoxin HigA
MASIKDLRAARKLGPGYFIREQMEIRGWVQEELADILGISVKHLSSILQDKQAISIDIAKRLSKVFGTSPHYWLHIDNDYRLWLEHGGNEEIDSLAAKALIFSRMPIRDMFKKGWLPPTNDVNKLSNEVKEYWKINKLDFDFLEEALIPLCKKSEAYNQFNAYYAATWFQMAKNTSLNYKVREYKKERLEELYKSISDFTIQEDGISTFIKELNNSGVKFFVLPHLEKTYLDGSAFLFKDNPVIVYTARYKRIDNFWFTVAHEIAHVLKHLNDTLSFVLDNFREEPTDIKEKEANKLASKHLKHPEILDFLQPHFDYLTTNKVIECSEALDVHPSIIIGALAFNKTISYRNINLFNENVLENIPEQYIHESIYIN